MANPGIVDLIITANAVDRDKLLAHITTRYPHASPADIRSAMGYARRQVAKADRELERQAAAHPEHAALIERQRARDASPRAAMSGR